MKIILPLLLFPLLACASASVADGPVPTAERYYRAAKDKDIEELARLFHQQSLGGHREFVEIALMKLERIYGEQAVWAVVGRPKAEMSVLSDLDYFRESMKTALELSVVDARPSSSRPRIVGQLSDGDLVYILSNQDSFIEESGREFSMKTPQSLAFKKDGDEWKVFAFPFAAHVSRLYATELAAASKAAAEQ